MKFRRDVCEISEGAPEIKKSWNDRCGGYIVLISSGLDVTFAKGTSFPIPVPFVSKSQHTDLGDKNGSRKEDLVCSRQNLKQRHCDE